MLGRAAMLLFFDIADGAIAEHDDWHTHEHLPERLSIPGFLRGCYLFEAAAAAPMTREQSIRGKDAGLDWVLVATGYDAEAVSVLEHADLARLEGAGFGLYRTDYTLHEAE